MFNLKTVIAALFATMVLAACGEQDGGGMPQQPPQQPPQQSAPN